MKLRDGLLVILGVLLIIVIGRTVLNGPGAMQRTLPEELCGVWVTANPEYSDRYLELGSDFITFGTGGVNSRRFEVTGFDRDRDEKGRDLNTVYFRDVDGSKFSRQFHVSTDNGRQLVFHNQPDVVWLSE